MAPSSDPLRQSVVKLFTVTRKPSYYQPWGLEYARPSGGSACILSGNRILTNAHVLAHAMYIQALKTGDTRKVTAKIDFIDHDRELAILSVDDEQFFEGTSPVQFGELPVRQDKLSVYGFPVGGNELCVTEGVASRIEVRRYVHAHRDLLAIQTDAAINPGNSGGPVFRNGKLAGIAFQGLSASVANRVGYFIPTCVIEQFLADIATGTCKGVPSLGAFWQKTEGAALREHFGLEPRGGGVLVTRVIHGSSAAGQLHEHDVIVAIDETPIACDGSVVLRGEDRVTFSHVVSGHQVGDPVTLDVLRRGERMKVELVLKAPSALVARPRYAPSPYFIFAGLVFVPLSWDYVSAWEWKDADARLRHYCMNELPSEDRKEIVLLNQVLAHDVNVGYHQMRGVVVVCINGIRITELRDVPRAFQKPKGNHHVIEVDNHAGWGEAVDYHSAIGTTIVLRADEAAAAGEAILKRYAIDADRSPPDLI